MAKPTWESTESPVAACKTMTEYHTTAETSKTKAEKKTKAAWWTMGMGNDKTTTTRKEKANPTMTMTTTTTDSINTPVAVMRMVRNVSDASSLSTLSHTSTSPSNYHQTPFPDRSNICNLTDEQQDELADLVEALQKEWKDLQPTNPLLYPQSLLSMCPDLSFLTKSYEQGQATAEELENKARELLMGLYEEAMSGKSPSLALQQSSEIPTHERVVVSTEPAIEVLVTVTDDDDDNNNNKIR